MRLRRFLVFSSIVALCTAAAAQTQNSGASALAIRHITVVDVRAGRLAQDQTVLIEAGRISRAGSTSSIRIPSRARILDGTGRFLIPGLWDMHTHFSKKVAPEIDMPQYVAAGVTGVREMNSWLDCKPPAPEDDACITEKREWQRRVDAGDLLGPRIVALGGPLMNGPPAQGGPRPEPAFLATATADEAQQAARFLKDHGVDFMKIYTGIRREPYLALMDEARRIGLPAAGHRPSTVSLVELSNAGQRSIEHAHTQDFLLPCWSGFEEFRANPQPPSAELARRIVAGYDTAICQQIFQTFVRNGTWWVPTLMTRKNEGQVEGLKVQTDARLKYVLASRQAIWRAGMGRGATARLPAEVRSEIYRKLLEITGQGHRAGVRMLVGTDAGASFVFKGSSMHEEMIELAKAGLTPAQVLKAATLDAAEFLGKSTEFGTIEKGKFADMVLLTGNPLSQIQNTQKIDAVILGGRHFDRSELDRMLENVARAVKEIDQKK